MLIAYFVSSYSRRNDLEIFLQVHNAGIQYMPARKIAYASLSGAIIDETRKSSVAYERRGGLFVNDGENFSPTTRENYFPK